MRADPIRKVDACMYLDYALDRIMLCFGPFWGALIHQDITEVLGKLGSAAGLNELSKVRVYLYKCVCVCARMHTFDQSVLLTYRGAGTLG